jgi:PDDEXK-like uncharacterized protein DUF3799
VNLVTKPGVYDMSDEAYHADPVAGGSLSASGAKRLLECPAKFDWDRRHHARHTDVFDFGHAAHKLVLGAGAELAVVDAKDWSTKAAKAAKAAAHAAGKIPILVGQHETALAMETTVRQHPLASVLLKPGSGEPEKTLVWRDDEYSIFCRAKLDWLRRPQAGQRRLIVDYKTATSAERERFRRAVANYGYHIQDAWYRNGVESLGLAPDGAAFVFVVQEKTPPYIVELYQLDVDFQAKGWAKCVAARERFRDCQEAGVWPGYDNDFETPIKPPKWMEYDSDY